MSKFKTNNNTEYNSSEGVGFGGWFGATETLNHRSYTSSVSSKTYKVPFNDMVSLYKSEVNKLIEETERKGRKLTDDEVYSIVGSSVGAKIN